MHIKNVFTYQNGEGSSFSASFFKENTFITSVYGNVSN